MKDMGSKRRNSITDRPSRLALFWRRYRRFAWGFPPAVVAVLIFMYPYVTDWRFSYDTRGATIKEVFNQALVHTGFRVEHVLIEGQSRTPREDIQKVAGVLDGQSIFMVRLDEIRQRIEAMSTVAAVTVSRRLPHTVSVSIEEKVPFAVWQNEKKYFFVDRLGSVLGAEIRGSQDVLASIGLPFILGRSAPRRFASLFDLMKSRPELIKKLDMAEFIDDRRWDLLLRSGAKVLLPEYHEAAALTRLMELHQQTALLDRPVRTIDMRLGDRLVINPGPPATAPSPGRP